MDAVSICRNSYLTHAELRPVVVGPRGVQVDGGKGGGEKQRDLQQHFEHALVRSCGFQWDNLAAAITHHLDAPFLPCGGGVLRDNDYVMPSTPSQLFHNVLCDTFNFAFQSVRICTVQVQTGPGKPFDYILQCIL